MKFIIISLIAIFVCLQYKFWFSDSGVRQYFALQKAIRVQTEENKQLDAQNQALLVEIHQLQSDPQAIEAHARQDLGLIKPGETFYQVDKP